MTLPLSTTWKLDRGQLLRSYTPVCPMCTSPAEVILTCLSLRRCWGMLSPGLTSHLTSWTSCLLLVGQWRWDHAREATLAAAVQVSMLIGPRDAWGHQRSLCSDWLFSDSQNSLLCWGTVEGACLMVRGSSWGLPMLWQSSPSSSHHQPTVSVWWCHNQKI